MLDRITWGHETMLFLALLSVVMLDLNAHVE
jgi:hypothetical protein